MILYGYSTPTPRLSVAELDRRTQWSNLDAEFRRRLLALFEASGYRVGIGGGWRSTAQQRQLFLSRYHVSASGTITFEGKRWAKNAGVASAAPPGLSFHEECTRDGKALAADLIGDLRLAQRLAPTFGLHDFERVNDELWHHQPVEIPNARRYYTGSPLARWTWPGSDTPTPVPPADPEADVKYLRVRVPNDATRAEALVLLDIRGYDTPADRDAVGRVLATEDRPVTAAQYDALLAVFGS